MGQRFYTITQDRLNTRKRKSNSDLQYQRKTDTSSLHMSNDMAMETSKRLRDANIKLA